ncbi:MFS transporter [Jiangella asiatica]|uniref:MFS transporter n=1 Tax=Jiangella asiatica TaxID=2530372 RepID=A0A4R5DG61_9ACTN|nr:MFS transporter [Jiangella asiatica]TDE10930.1 MFS transporter [Jiangella asiatica]
MSQARALWPVLLAAAVSLFPFTVYSTFLVPIAAAAGADTAAVGALRGLGGVAALVTGVALAPVVDLVSKHRSGAAALVVLAASSLLATEGSYPALLAFCLGVGTATAVLTPSLLAAASEAAGPAEAAGRAATLVTAVGSLAAVLAGPAIGVMAGWRGWQGALVITAGLALAVAAVLAARPVARGAVPASRGSYRGALRSVLTRPLLAALVLCATLRTAAFMGHLAYLAAVYDERFGLDARTFTLVWTLSGASFFAGNLAGGRWANDARAPAARPHRMLVAGLIGATVAVVAVFQVTVFGLALLATAVLAASHAVVAAAVTTLIVRGDPTIRGAALSVNAAGMSLGVFLGAALGGAGLALAGYAGIAAVLGGLTLVALVIAVAVGRRPH